MTIILDTFIEAIYLSSLAFCFVAWFVSYVSIAAYCPPKSYYHNSLLRSVLIGVKIICALSIPTLLWLYIAVCIIRLNDSIFFDPDTFWQVRSNAVHRMDEHQWLKYALLFIFAATWWQLSAFTIPNAIKKVRSKMPYPTTTKEKIKTEILGIFEQIQPFILIAISPIIIIPLFMFIFGWLIE